ncbi:WD domain, G-beta repeat-containing protein [Babesia caballi]|uniref:WD domain, G-beta repeat-containing protein n=1 Tax=Babesia caballi TaxID=5871 RepID=A0AAV4LM19_BABCB|nr:WD domain, G-beta repeat-containing protein [Babesia caballi]
MRITRVSHCRGSRGSLSSVDFQPHAQPRTAHRLATAAATDVQIWALWRAEGSAASTAPKCVCLYTFRGHSPFEVATARWSPNGRYVASTDTGGVTHILERCAEESSLLEKSLAAQQPRGSAAPATEQGPTTPSAKETRKFTFKYDGTSSKRSKLLTSPGSGGAANSKRISFDTQSVFREAVKPVTVENSDGNFELWASIQSFRCPSRMGQLFDLSWAPDNRSIVGGGLNGQVAVFDIFTKQVVARFDVFEGLASDTVPQGRGYVKSVAWDPMTLHVAVQTSDRQISVWRRSPPHPEGSPQKWTFRRVLGDSNLFQKTQSDVFGGSRISWAPNGQLVAFPSAGVSNVNFAACFEVVHADLSRNKELFRGGQLDDRRLQLAYDTAEHCVRPDAMLLRGHRSRVRNVRFSQDLMVADKRGLCKGAAVSDSDRFIFYAQSSDDGIVSIWRFKQSSNWHPVYNNEAQCVCVIEEASDEQSSLEDLAWGNSSKWLAVATSQGGLILVELTEDETATRYRSNWMDGLSIEDAHELRGEFLEKVEQYQSSKGGQSTGEGRAAAHSGSASGAHHSTKQATVNAYARAGGTCAVALSSGWHLYFSRIGSLSKDWYEHYRRGFSLGVSHRFYLEHFAAVSALGVPVGFWLVVELLRALEALGWGLVTFVAALLSCAPYIRYTCLLPSSCTGRYEDGNKHVYRMLPGGGGAVVACGAVETGYFLCTSLCTETVPSWRFAHWRLKTLEDVAADDLLLLVPPPVPVGRGLLGQCTGGYWTAGEHASLSGNSEGGKSSEAQRNSLKRADSHAKGADTTSSAAPNDESRPTHDSTGEAANTQSAGANKENQKPKDGASQASQQVRVRRSKPSEDGSVDIWLKMDYSGVTDLLEEYWASQRGENGDNSTVSRQPGCSSVIRAPPATSIHPIRRRSSVDSVDDLEVNKVAVPSVPVKAQPATNKHSKASPKVSAKSTAKASSKVSSKVSPKVSPKDSAKVPEENTAKVPGNGATQAPKENGATDSTPSPTQHPTSSPTPTTAPTSIPTNTQTPTQDPVTEPLSQESAKAVSTPASFFEVQSVRPSMSVTVMARGISHQIFAFNEAQEEPYAFVSCVHMDSTGVLKVLWMKRIVKGYVTHLYALDPLGIVLVVSQLGAPTDQLDSAKPTKRRKWTAAARSSGRAVGGGGNRSTPASQSMAYVTLVETDTGLTVMDACELNGVNLASVNPVPCGRSIYVTFTATGNTIGLYRLDRVVGAQRWRMAQLFNFKVSSFVDGDGADDIMQLQMLNLPLNAAMFSGYQGKPPGVPTVFSLPKTTETPKPAPAEEQSQRSRPRGGMEELSLGESVMQAMSRRSAGDDVVVYAILVHMREPRVYVLTQQYLPVKIDLSICAALRPQPFSANNAVSLLSLREAYRGKLEASRRNEAESLFYESVNRLVEVMQLNPLLKSDGSPYFTRTGPQMRPRTWVEREQMLIYALVIGSRSEFILSLHEVIHDMFARASVYRLHDSISMMYKSLIEWHTYGWRGKPGVLCGFDSRMMRAIGVNVFAILTGGVLPLLWSLYEALDVECQSRHLGQLECKPARPDMPDSGGGCHRYCARAGVTCPIYRAREVLHSGDDTDNDLLARMRRVCAALLRNVALWQRVLTRR